MLAENFYLGARRVEYCENANRDKNIMFQDLPEILIDDLEL